MVEKSQKRVIVGITGASGAVYGIRALQMLVEAGIETHLIISASAEKTIRQETTWKIADLQSIAHRYYSNLDIGAAVASGSFQTHGMIIAPCSIKTLSAVANCYTSDLISRAADVTLKEGRPLLLAVREAPFHSGHLRLMQLAAESGAVIFPPIPSFYGGTQTVDEMVTETVGRMLFRMGIENTGFTHWQGGSE